MVDINIRLEKPKDYRAVEEITRAAFNTPDRVERSKIGCPMEHHMVYRLREKDGIMALSFVAEVNSKIVGHIIYSNAHILQPDGSQVMYWTSARLAFCQKCKSRVLAVH